MKNFSVTTIKNELTAGDFKSLQLFMLKQNAKDHCFYDYQIVKPQFKGDNWSAFYYRDITRDL